MGMIVEKQMNLTENEKEKFCKEWNEVCESLKSKKIVKEHKKITKTQSSGGRRFS